MTRRHNILANLFTAFLLLGAVISNPKSNNIVNAASTDAYYTTANSVDVTEKSGDSLRTALADIHEYLDKNKKLSLTSYNDVRTYTKNSDTDPNKSGNILLFYARASVSGEWDGGKTWNREHVWPQSLSGGLYGTSGPGSDLHHIRPSDPTINSTRNNTPYGEVEEFSDTPKEIQYNSVGTGNFYIGSTVFEPRDDIKGDVARIIMYMYTNYDTTKLKITNVITTKSGSESAAWALLLKWNKLDPVDSLETARNNYIYSLQGNRNAFIDHPEFADMCFDSSYSGAGALVDDGGGTGGDIIEVTSISVTPSTLSLKTNESQALTATVYPTNASNKSVTWTSANSGIATVDANGTVKGISIGQTEITAKAGSYTAKAIVTVLEGPSGGGNVGVSTKVTSINQIDSAKKYVLGNAEENIYHYLYEPGWGRVANNTEQEPLLYTLSVKDLNNNYFEAKTTISGVENYLTVPTDKNYFAMESSSGNTTSLKLGGNGEVYSTNGSRLLKYNKSSNGIRSYATSNTSPAVYFYEVSSSGDETDPLVSISVSGDMTQKTYSSDEQFVADGLIVKATYQSGAEKDVTSAATWSYSVSPAELGVGDNKSVNVTATYEGKTATTTISGITIQDASAVGKAMFDFTNSANTHLCASELVKTPATVKDITLSVNRNGSTTAVTNLNPIKLYKSYIVTIQGNETVSAITSLDIVVDTGYSDLSDSTWDPAANVTVDGRNVNVAFDTATSVITVKLAAQARLYSLNVNYTKGQAPVVQKVESITVNPSSLNLAVGATSILTASVLPENAADKGITWASSNSGVASVDNDGNVTAIAAGNATITATANDGSGVVGNCSVVVNTPAPTPEPGTPIIDFTAASKITSGECSTEQGVNLTVTHNDGYSGYSSTKGAQFGSTKKPADTVKLETADHKFSASSSEDLKIVVNASTTSDGDATATLKVFVGYCQIGEVCNLSTKATDYTFNVPKGVTGKIRIELYSGAAVYMKSLQVYGAMEAVTADDEAAYALADKIVGLDTCKDYKQATALRNEYNGLSDAAKAAFDAIVVEESKGNVTLGDKLAYMEYMQAKNTSTASSTQNILIDTTSNASLVLVIGLMGVVSIAGYYFINKRRLYR